MKSADTIKRLFKSAVVSTHSPRDNDVFRCVQTAYTRSRENGSAKQKPTLWRFAMKSPLTKLATAAIVAIACLIGLSLWRGTESGIALADVLTQIEKARAYRYQCSSKMTSVDPNKPYSSETRATKLISQEYGSKTKFERLEPNGGWTIFQQGYLFPFPEKKTMILIYPEKKKYTRIENDDRFAELFWQVNSDPSFWAKRVLGCKYESMGRSIVDGIEVEGFRTTDPNILPGVRDVDNKMWVDVKTRLPVRYDFRCAHVDKMGNKKEIEQIVYCNFQWDILVEASEFKPAIPDDYIGVVLKYPAHITEETAIQGLKLLVELLGKYPETPNFDETVLRLAENSETPAALRLKEEIKGLTEDEITNKLADFLMPIRGLARFYVLLHQDKKDPAYYGRIVTPKDADKVLLRWKVSDTECRVIYGDLHAETVTPERLAELEAALPKEPMEETAIQGLKQCVELFGNYPGSIDYEGLSTAFEKSETPAALRLKEETKGLTKQEKDIRLIRAAMPTLNLSGFYYGLVQDKKDPAYYGKTVTPKDADKVLMRWKLSDNEYRVIFGDLHAETVTPAKLAELEAALPK